MENRATYESRRLIFSEGDKANKLYMVEYGEVLCVKSAKDRLIPVFLAKTGDIIGENAMVENAVYSYSAFSLEKTGVSEISGRDVQELLKKGPFWLPELTKTMVHRFHDTAALVAENRILHSAIIPEEKFPSELEVELKRHLTVQ